MLLVFFFGFFRQDGVCFFGFVMSLGFSNCIIFLETSAFPNSHDGLLCLGPKSLHSYFLLHIFLS